MSPLVTLPFCGFLIAVLLHLSAQRLFPYLGLLDFPERYKLQRGRLPYPTGILAVIAFLVLFPILEHFNLQGKGLLLAIILLAVTCFTDDRRPLPSWSRLLLHIVIALLLFGTGTRIYSLTNPLSSLIGFPVLSLDTWHLPTSWGLGPLPIWSGLFTILWIGLTINALNWFDGIPGQVSTLSSIGFLTIGLLSLSSRVHQPELALIAFVLSGISVACLLFDAPPPHVVMGDSGSMFFGLMLGTLTIYAGGKVATAFLVLGVPLLDLLIVAVRRIAQGRSPLKGSLKGEHLHHRLLAKGWSPRQVIALTAGLGTLFGITALFLNTFEKFLAASALFLIMLILSRYSRPS